MKAYILEQMSMLRTSIDEENRRFELNTYNIHNTRKNFDSFKPLPQQIEELMSSLPSPLRNRLWTMADFVSKLKGKYRANPHPQQIAMALLTLGWSRRRIWGGGYNGARVWVPPDA